RAELHAFLQRNAERLARACEKLRAGDTGLAARVEETRRKLEGLAPLLDSPTQLDLEDLERRLTVLEEKLTASLTAAANEELLLEIRREMDRALSSYRRKMTAEQLAQLERQYTQKRLFEKHDLPRLSLFYLT
ncbi:MAG TPA: hypothetical protein VHM88_08290, partial [Candidatus Acidoferrales bacterium]|nr:hypothetical protein [Candidatus Acidoferrales bacterium]